MRTLAVAIFLCLLLMPAFARADASIAVVDVQILLTRSSAAQDIQKQIDGHKNNVLSSFSREEEKLREEEKQLADLRGKIPAADFTVRASDFEKRLLEARQRAQGEKRRFDDISGEGMNKLRDAVYDVVQQIADEKGYSLVISRQNVVIGAKNIDITDEALARLDKSLASIPLDFGGTP